MWGEGMPARTLQLTLTNLVRLDRRLPTVPSWTSFRKSSSLIPIRDREENEDIVLPQYTGVCAPTGGILLEYVGVHVIHCDTYVLLKNDQKIHVIHDVSHFFFFNPFSYTWYLCTWVTPT